MRKYDCGFKPPAAALMVKLRNPMKPSIMKDKKAILDSGAYITVIPHDLVRRLKLVQAGEKKARGYKGGTPQTHWTYFVNIEANNSKFPFVEVIAVDRKNVLLGRDVLNRTKVLLDGKNLSFCIFDP